MITRTPSLVGPWRTSSYSSPNGQCVECANPAWRTSSHSGNRQNCVEVSEGPTTALRDSKHPDHGALFFTAREWCAFLGAAKCGSL
jgi:hypothetical protein